MSRATGCTMEEFAEATGIPASFLNQIGITEVDRTQGRAVRLSDAVTYLAPPPSDGMGDDEAVERRDSSSALFGLDSLDLIAETGSVYLVADEIEALTLRFHGLPALAVPPVARWAEGWPALDEAAVVYVVITDTDQPAVPPAWIAEAQFRDRVRLVQVLKGFGVRHLHRHSPRFFLDAWKTICEGALAWTECAAGSHANSP